MFDRVLNAPYSGAFFVNFEQLAFIILNLFLIVDYEHFQPVKLNESVYINNKNDNPKRFILLSA